MSRRSPNPSYEGAVSVLRSNSWINPDPIKLTRKERLRRMRDDRMRGKV